MPWKPQYEGDFPTLGWHVADQMAEYLGRPDAGDDERFEPFVVTREQQDILNEIYRLDPVTGRRLIHRAMVVKPRGWGKSPFVGAVMIAEAMFEVVPDGWDADGQPVAKPWSRVRTPYVAIGAVSEEQPLALDTPVWTPSGWSTVGALRVGDQVFASDGSPTRVSRTTEVFLGKACFEVKFDDGETIIASAGHGWTVERRNGHGDAFESITLTTSELAESLRAYPRRVIRVPLVATQGVPRDLPVDPYLLGLWLGDGATRDSTIAVEWATHDELRGIVESHIEPWEEIVSTHAVGNGGTIRVRRKAGMCPRGHDYASDVSNLYPDKYGNPGCRKCNGGRHEGRREPKLLSFRERLRAAGVLGNKHIPIDYLTAPYEARMELLRGLVDSDGNVTIKGQAGFVNANERLFDDVLVLLSSLGFRWYVTKAAGTARRVRWQPRPDEPVAKLRHKVERQRLGNRDLSRHRRLVSVVPVDSVPVRCIGIDTDDHLFLAGKRMTLTHNTKNTWEPILEMLRNGSAPDELGCDPMDTFVALPRGRMQPITASATSIKGFKAVAASLDQTETWLKSNGGVRLAQTLRNNATKLGGITVETPNAYTIGEHSVAEESFAFWDAIQSGKFVALEEVRSIYVDFRKTPAVDIGDQDELVEALRVAYGDSSKDPRGCVIHEPACEPGWVDLERIALDFLDTSNDPAQMRADFLNQLDVARDAYVSEPELHGVLASKEISRQEPVTLGFDGSEGRKRGIADSTVLVGYSVTQKHAFKIGLWEQPEGPRGDGWRPPKDEINAAVKKAFRDYNVVGFYADPSAGWAGDVKDWESQFGSGLKARMSASEPIRWRQREVTRTAETFEQLYSMIRGQEITIENDPDLIRHFLNARRDPRRAGYVLKKPDDNQDFGKIDLAWGVMFAVAAGLDAVGKGVGTGRRRAPRRLV